MPTREFHLERLQQLTIIRTALLHYVDNLFPANELNRRQALRDVVANIMIAVTNHAYDKLTPGSGHVRPSMKVWVEHELVFVATHAQVVHTLDTVFHSHNVYLPHISNHIASHLVQAPPTNAPHARIRIMSQIGNNDIVVHYDMP